jgi:3-oxoacyl-[acyl-carrier protein] reductase
MNLQLSGKTAVVLASSAGLGKAIANVLSSEGCKVAICGRREDVLKETANLIREQFGNEVFSQVADVADAASLQQFLEAVYAEFGGVDILVNNAGGPPAGESSAFGDTHYQAAFELSLMSVVRASSFVLPKMRAQGSGRIITVTSTTAKIATKNMLLSTVFRSAVSAFCKSIAMESGKDGVRVHTVMPGPFLTDRAHELGSIAAKNQGISFDEWLIKAQSNTPLERFGRPEEMANIVAFLASDLSDYMNGTSIAIDGGVLAPVI